MDSLPDEFKPEKIVEVVKFVEVTPEPKPVQEGLELLGDLLSEGTVEEKKQPVKSTKKKTPAKSKKKK